MTTNIIIRSVQDAIDLINKENQDISYEFSEEFVNIKILIEGSRYNSSIPAELARALWQYQEHLYKAVAFALYGVEDIRKLTTQQRQDFELNFKVEEGSTEIVAALISFLEKLSDGFMTMDPVNKRRTIVSIALIITGGLGIHEVSQFMQKREELRASVQMENSKQAVLQTAIEGLSDNNKGKIQAFQKAIDEGGQAIVRGADDAQQITVPGKIYTRDEIVDITQRAPREAAIAVSDIREYKIVTTNTKSMDVIKLGLIDIKTGEEITANFIRDDMTMEDINDIWAAAQKGTPITLEVSKNFRKNTLFQATILGVRRENNKSDVPTLQGDNHWVIINALRCPTLHHRRHIRRRYAHRALWCARPVSAGQGSTGRH